MSERMTHRPTPWGRASVNAVTVFDLFSKFPIVDEICACLGIGDIISLTRTCKALSSLYRSLLSSQWNVDKHLRRFVDSPVNFRSQMARCDALVSGSLALQLFQRVTWLDSDLDLYTNAEGSSQFRRYLCEKEGYVPTEDRDLADDYASTDELVEVHSLIKEKREGDNTKIQIVTTKSDPLLCILGGFYSTVVVHFFSWQKAYSIFPHATFIDRRCYMLKKIDQFHAPRLAKYSRRGWQLQDVVWAGEPPVPALEGMRRAGDHHSWIIPLNTKGVEQAGKPDHVFAFANFHVRKYENFEWGCRGPTFYIIDATGFRALVLRYRYIYASPSWRDFLGTRMDSLTTMELLKLDPTERPSWFTDAIRFPMAHYCAPYIDDPWITPTSWKFYDEEVPKWYRQWQALQAVQPDNPLKVLSATSSSH